MSVDLSRRAARITKSKPYARLSPQDRTAFARATDQATSYADLDQRWQQLLTQAEQSTEPPTFEDILAGYGITPPKKREQT